MAWRRLAAVECVSHLDDASTERESSDSRFLLPSVGRRRMGTPSDLTAVLNGETGRPSRDSGALSGSLFALIVRGAITSVREPAGCAGTAMRLGWIEGVTRCDVRL